MDNLKSYHDRPSRRELWLLALAALVVRLVYVAVTAHIRHFSLLQYANLGDGHGYLDYAKFIGGDSSSLRPDDERLFPGYPALIAMVHLLGIPRYLGALAMAWISAAIVAPLGAVLFQSRRVGWALVFWIPDYILITSVDATEGPLLVATLLGLLIAVRGKKNNSAIAAGLLFGIAGVIRPMACFAVLGFFIWAWSENKILRGIFASAVAATVVVLAMIGMHHLWGDSLIGAKAYSHSAYHDQLFTWPFGSIINTPIKQHAPLAKVLYVWGHVGLAFGAVGFLAARLLSSRRQSLDALSLPWLAGLLIFNLCVGDVWGFECFARFLVPALPALFDSIKPFLPKKRATILPLGAISFAFAVVSYLRRS